MHEAQENIMTMTLPPIGNSALTLSPAGIAAPRVGIRDLTAAEIEHVSGGGPALEKAKQVLRDAGDAFIAIGGGAAIAGAVPVGLVLIGIGGGLYLATTFC